MVLCPFVFLLTHHEPPSPKLQPAEVGSTHWVSIRALLNPTLRTFEHVDVSDRLARRGGPLARHFLRLMLGQMRFAAVRLIPTESLYCSTAPGFLPSSPSPAPAINLPNPATKSNAPTILQPTLATVANLAHSLRALTHSLTLSPKQLSTDKPLLLWGLTLDILADFLQMLPPHNEASLWTYPTYTPLDLRFVTWLVTYSFRRRKRIEIERGVGADGMGPARVEVGLDAVADGEVGEPGQARRGEEQGGGQRVRGGHRVVRSSAVRVMLDGYFVLLNKAVIVALMLRLGVGAGLGFMLWRQLRRLPRRI